MARSETDDPMGESTMTGTVVAAAGPAAPRGGPLPDPCVAEATARVALLSTCEEGAICRLPGAADIAVATCDGVKLD
eukprot:5612113-Lingulodinium_polyedra.AAC.1